MLVSVIIPAYNCISFLPATVRQIFRSGLRDFEILLIDDGSADGTGQVCDGLAREYDNVRCIHQPNAGVSAARNQGIAESRGEYIWFVDADDGVDAGAVTHAEEILRQTQPDILIFGMGFDYYHRGRLYRRDELVYPAEGIRTRVQLAEIFEDLFRHNALSPVWNKLIRRSLLMDNGIRFEPDLIEMEDFVFSVNCLCRCSSAYLLPEAVYRYRQAEAERNTYNRLCRIGSLTAYMEPFKNCMEQWQKASGRKNSGLDMVGQIYAMFLVERLRYASVREIKAVARDLDGSMYKETVEKHAPALFQMLMGGRFFRIWLRNGMSRIRHWMAVRVKYLRSFILIFNKNFKAEA